MKATILRRRLQDLRLAEQLIKNTREDVKNLDSVRARGLHMDLANIEAALATVRRQLMQELVDAGIIDQQINRAFLD